MHLKMVKICWWQWEEKAGERRAQKKLEYATIALFSEATLSSPRKVGEWQLSAPVLIRELDTPLSEFHGGHCKLSQRVSVSRDDGKLITAGESKHQVPIWIS